MLVAQPGDVDTDNDLQLLAGPAEPLSVVTTVLLPEAALGPAFSWALEAAQAASGASAPAVARTALGRLLVAL